jgi:hypothetical protein
MKKQEKRKGKAKSYLGALIQMLEGLDFDEAQRAARALGETADPAAIKALVNVFKRSSSVRAAAMAALKKISAQNDAAVTELAIALLKEKGEQEAMKASAGTVSPADRRRMPRVLLEIPVVVNWVDQKGQPHTEPSTTKLVNAYGALIQLQKPVVVGLELEITNVSTQSKARARVVWVGSPLPEGGLGIGVELLDPDPEFWVGYP